MVVVDDPCRHIPAVLLKYCPVGHAVKPLTRRLYSRNRTRATRAAIMYLRFITLITYYYSSGSGGVARNSTSANKPVQFSAVSGR